MEKSRPLLIKKACFEGILNYDGKDGLKGAVNASGAKKKIVEVDDSGILALNGETEADGDFKKMRMTYKIRLSREKVFYGTGVHQLLGLIEEQGSLLEACRYMNISYSKGRKIIHTMEEQLDTAMLETQNGGRGGGYSRLTDKAKELMRNYEDFNNEAKVVLEDLFEKYFESYKY
mgnify:CR=1 FL=1